MRAVRIVIAAVWLAGGGLLAAGSGAAAESSPGGALPFEVGEAQMQTLNREQVYDAVIEAEQQSTVSAQTSGRITEINFDVDDYVEKGAVLLRIRDREQRAAFNSAQAQAKEAEAEFKRIKDLYQRKLVSKSQYDKAEATLKTAQANLDQAREQLEHTVVRAPYSGIVTKRFVEIGETAKVGQPLMSGVSLESLRATVSVPETVIDTVRQHGKARVIFSDAPESQGRPRSVEATKLTFFPYADTQTHTFKVRLQLPPGQKGVYPGMFAKAAFVVGKEQQLVVPTAAIVHRSEVTAVYVVDAKDRVSLRQIRIGRTLDEGANTVVLAGLSAGERVALNPIRAGVYLKDSLRRPTDQGVAGHE